jgi:hypothetical protein
MTDMRGVEWVVVQLLCWHACGMEQLSGTAWLHMWPSEWAAAGSRGFRILRIPVGGDRLKRVIYFITHVSGPSQPSPAEGR